MRQSFLYIFLFLVFTGTAAAQYDPSAAEYHPSKTLLHWGGKGWQHGRNSGSSPSFNLVYDPNYKNEELMIVTDSDVCNSYNPKAECSRLRLVDSRDQEVILDRSYPTERNMQAPRRWPVRREQLQGLKGTGKSVMEGRFFSSAKTQGLEEIFESDVDFDRLNRVLDDDPSEKL